MTRRIQSSLPSNAESQPIPGHPEYVVTREGQVYSTIAAKAGSEPTALIASPRMQRNRRGVGRLRVKLGPAKSRVSIDLASVVCEVYHGERPGGAIIEFLDGNQMNCHADNLAWRLSRSGVSDIEFVRAWQASETSAECADRLGVSSAAVSSRVERLTKKGVRLRQPSTRLDVDALNLMIESEK
jgi:hypothetical protein